MRPRFVPDMSGIENKKGKKTMEVEYPRVLIIYRGEINEYNSGGVAIGNWFRPWPKNKLAHILSGSINPVLFCAKNYLITGRERRFGLLFSALRRNWSYIGEETTPAGFGTFTLRRSFSQSFKAMVRYLAFDTGLWEFIFAPKLSLEMVAWIEDFKPDVIYMPADFSFSWYALLVSQRFNIPIVPHIMDDWPSMRYRDTFMGGFIHRAVTQIFMAMLTRAPICLTIGPGMKKEYAQRYGIPTEALMCCDDPKRFMRHSYVVPHDAKDSIIVTYCGGLHQNRWKSMMDVAQACQTLRNRGMPIVLNIHTTNMPREAREKLSGFTCTNLLPTPKNEDVPKVLTASTILVHVESFDRKIRQYIRLSVSSKSQIYMMSGRPIFIYGPKGVDVVEYAKAEGWAAVVNSQGTKEVIAELVLLIQDTALQQRICAQAAIVAERHHAAEHVRERLRQIFCDVVERYRK